MPFWQLPFVAAIARAFLLNCFPIINLAPVNLTIQTLVIATLSLFVVLTVALLGGNQRSRTDNRYLIALLVVNSLLLLRAALALSGVEYVQSATWIAHATLGGFSLIPGLLYAWVRGVADPSWGLDRRTWFVLALPGLVVFLLFGVSFAIRSQTLGTTLLDAAAVPVVTLAERAGWLFGLHTLFWTLYIAGRKHLTNVAAVQRPLANIIFGVFGVHWLISGLAGVTSLLGASAVIVSFLSSHS